MNTLERVYTQCDICGRDIDYGNAVLEIHRNVEQHDYKDESSLHTVTVIDTDPLLTACARCGNSIANRKKLCKLLLVELGLSDPVSNEDTIQQTEAGLSETCECCGDELKRDKTRVTLVKLIGQMDWSVTRGDGELFVIDGEDILSFCPDCGNRMNTYRLQQALQRVLDDLAVPKLIEYGISSHDTGPDGTPKNPVKILHIAAEGGAITLYGWKDTSGEWQFSRETNESALYCKDTADLQLHHFSGVAPGWHGALELLSRYPWYCLHPVYVHPEFIEQTMKALHNVSEENQQHIDYEAWQAVCAGKDPWGERI